MISLEIETPETITPEEALAAVQQCRRLRGLLRQFVEWAEIAKDEVEYDSQAGIDMTKEMIAAGRAALLGSFPEEQSPMATFVQLLHEARTEAMYRNDKVYLSDDEQGNWETIRDGDENAAPCLLLGIAPDGSVRIVDNNGAYADEEPWRR